MSTARSRSRGSNTVALPALVSSGEAGPAVLAEAKRTCGKKVSDAQSNLLTEVGTLRQETEAVKAQVIPMVSDLVKKVQAFEESSIQLRTADEERSKEVKDPRRDLNGSLELRAGTAQEMDLRFS